MLSSMPTKAQKIYLSRVAKSKCRQKVAKSSPVLLLKYLSIELNKGQLITHFYYFQQQFNRCGGIQKATTASDFGRPTSASWSAPKQAWSGSAARDWDSTGFEFCEMTRVRNPAGLSIFFTRWPTRELPSPSWCFCSASWSVWLTKMAAIKVNLLH